MASVAAVQVLTTATLLLAAPATGGSRGPVIVQNLGPNAIYLGTTAGVTTATGFQVPPTSGLVTIPDILNADAIYAIAATANQVSPADTRVLVGRA